MEAAAEVFAEQGFQAPIDEIAARAGYSKGAVYWHFDSKDDLLGAVLEERIDRPTHEMIELLRSAPAEQDMGPEGSRRFVELMRSERQLLLLENEYWSRAVRDPKVRARYRRRRARLRRRLAEALVIRMKHLGGEIDDRRGEAMATAIMGLGAGLAQERLIDPGAVPDVLFGDVIVLLYRGLAASG